MATATINGEPVSASFDIKLRWQSGGDGVLTLTLPASETPPPEIELRLDGELRFKGTLEQASLEEQPEGERRTVRYCDAWRKLRRRVWRQQYPFDGSARLIARCVLGGRWQSYDPPGAPAPGEAGQYELVPVDISRSLEDIIAVAGLDHDVDVEGVIPPAELTNTTCEQALQAALRWFPDTQAFCVPGTEQIRVVQPSEVFSLKVDGVSGEHPVVSGYHVLARPDLVIPGCEIDFIKTIRGRGSVETVTTVSAGAGNDFLNYIELADEVHVLEAAALELEAIDPTLLSWWTARDKTLASIAANIGKYPEFRSTPLSTAILREDEALTHEVVRGWIPDSFVEEGCSGPFGARQKVFSVSNGKEIKVGRVTVQALFRIWDATGGVPSDKQFYAASVDLPLCTDLEDSGVYCYEDKRQQDPGEDPSDFEGIADLIVSSTSKLGHEGWAEWVAEELPNAGDILGKLVRIVGTEWAEIDAPIFAVEQDVHSRTTRIEFGANSYLGPADYVELIRARKTPRRRRARADEDGGEVEPLSPPAQSGPPSTSQPEPRETGRVRVQIEPEAAVDAGAAWFAVCTDEQGKPMVSGPHPSDEFVRLPQGEAVIWFQPVSGWKPPAVITDYEVAPGDQTIADEDAAYEPLPAAALTPWRFELRRDPDSEDWEGVVHSEGSTLMDVGLDPSNLLEVAGLDVWQPVSAGDVAYLAGDVANGTWEVIIGEPWDPAFPPYEFDESDPPEVAFIYKLLGRVVEDGAGGLKAIPCVTTGLRLETMHDNGTYLDYPVGDSGGIEVDA